MAASPYAGAACLRPLRDYGATPLEHTPRVLLTLASLAGVSPCEEAVANVLCTDVTGEAQRQGLSESRAAGVLSASPLSGKIRGEAVGVVIADGVVLSPEVGGPMVLARRGEARLVAGEAVAGAGETVARRGGRGGESERPGSRDADGGPLGAAGAGLETVPRAEDRGLRLLARDGGGALGGRHAADSGSTTGARRPPREGTWLLGSASPSSPVPPRGDGEVVARAGRAIGREVPPRFIRLLRRGADILDGEGALPLGVQGAVGGGRGEDSTDLASPTA